MATLTLTGRSAGAVYLDLYTDLYPAQSITAGALANLDAINGTAVTATATAGQFTWAAALTGTAATVSAGTGSLTWTATLTGTATATSAATGSLTWAAVLAGAGSNATSGTGALAGPVTFTGTAAAISTTTGGLTRTAPAALYFDAYTDVYPGQITSITGAASTATSTTGPSVQVSFLVIVAGGIIPAVRAGKVTT